MNKQFAIDLLKSPNADDRLRAARFLANIATPDDTAALKEALFVENTRWIKFALKKAIQTATGVDEPKPLIVSAETEEERLVEEIHAQAVEITTQQLVHEIQPIIGRIDVYAQEEIPNYENSRTKAEWTRLESLLNAIDSLRRAAASPTNKEFDLGALVTAVIRSEIAATTVKVDPAGPRPFIIVSDSGLVELVLCNGLRNAIEATESIPLEARTESITVNWQKTDKDFWVTILDRGFGLPIGVSHLFEIGSTTKINHSGMGLAKAKQAALSLNGKIDLSARLEGGAKFEFRWPFPAA